MAFVIKADITGLEALLKQLHTELPQKMETKILRKAVAMGNKIILSSAKSLCPVASGDTVGVKKGLVRKSLGSKIKVYRQSHRVVGIIGPRTGMKDPETGMNPVNVAHLIEKGRKGVEIKTKKVLSNGQVVFGKKVRGVAARPFMRPALDQNIGAVRAAMADEITAGLESSS